MSWVMRAGLVGCGSVAQRGILPHLCAPDTQDVLRLVAVADVVEERARETAAHFGIEQAFANLDALLAGCDVDLIVVATPIPFHYADAMKAVVAGKHVYLNKTMTTTLDEANTLITAAERANVVLACAPGYDHCSTTREMRRLVQAGALGNIYTVYTYTLGFGHEQESIRQGSGVRAAIDPSWYYRKGAGPLPDVTVYSLQLVTSVLGPVQRVTALGNQREKERLWNGKSVPIEVEDNLMVVMEFASGPLGVAVGANCHGSTRIPWGGLGLYGSSGTLEVTEVDMNSGYPIAFATSGAGVGHGDPFYSTTLAAQPFMNALHAGMEEPHIYIDIMDMVRAITSDRVPLATAQQASHVVEIIEAAQRAVQTGVTQTLHSSFRPADFPPTA